MEAKKLKVFMCYASSDSQVFMQKQIDAWLNESENEIVIVDVKPTASNNNYLVAVTYNEY